MDIANRNAARGCIPDGAGNIAAKLNPATDRGSLHSSKSATAQEQTENTEGISPTPTPGSQPIGITIRLGFSELLVGVNVGSLRNIESVLKNRSADKHGEPTVDPWVRHIEGALAELAAAKALNVYWSAPVNTFKTGGDLGQYEVRLGFEDDYRLIIRNDDADEKIYILVVGRAPTFRVAGWMLGRDARKPQWLRSPGGRPPAWFVPRSKLRSLGTLPPPGGRQ
jgi:hypothetical protein